MDSNHKLTYEEELQIRSIYMDLWKTKKHAIGGPETWFEVIMTFLAWEGYEVVKKEKKERPE